MMFHFIEIEEIVKTWFTSNCLLLRVLIWFRIASRKSRSPIRLLSTTCICKINLLTDLRWAKVQDKAAAAKGAKGRGRKRSKEG